MSTQPFGRSSRRAPIAGLEPGERRGWLSHALAALAVSALGLAVAGSMTLTTQASSNAAGRVQGQTAAGQTFVRQSVTVTVPAAPELTATRSAAGQNTRANRGKRPSAAEQGALTSFTAPPTTTQASASEQVRRAVVKELAAQRAEDLAQAAEDATRATRAASSKVRANGLVAADRAAREQAVQIATERHQRALAARLAAVSARQQVEAAAKAATVPAPAQQSQVPPPTTPDPGFIPSGGHAVSPVPGAVIGARFGQYGLWARYHTGLDFRAGFGTPIRAVEAGVVLYAGNSGNWSGNHVAIQHAGGLTTMSSHMSSMAVSAGQTVRAGQVIGYVGQTGRAFGPHLHFELYPKGVKYGDIYRAIDPAPWLASIGVSTH